MVTGDFELVRMAPLCRISMVEARDASRSPGRYSSPCCIFLAGFNNISCLRHQNADLSAGFGLLFLLRTIAATDLDRRCVGRYSEVENEWMVASRVVVDWWRSMRKTTRVVGGGDPVWWFA